ncbi:hypothetical protein GCM10009836_67350 [Pseudonocardia ailaonensis]|uniref:histidine kinase n=1 Tax=Pseudonocardia ailaonensis TaxID=367279 RepID=A0ABN2NQA9_9PSEU
MLTKVRAWLPKGEMLDDSSWARRHRWLTWLLAVHVPLLVAVGLALGRPVWASVTFPLLIGLFVGVQQVLPGRRLRASVVAAGLSYSSIVLVGLTGGMIESHFHFFIVIGFISLYLDWVPLGLNVLITVVSHGVGATFFPNLIFNYAAAQNDPWLWAGIHGGAVLAASVGTVLLARITEDEQVAKEELGRELSLADNEIGRRRFTSDMLVNLARRNQSMLYRQLDIINQLEEKERDPDALAELFKLDHLATRVRRNAESLLVLSGEQPPRVWSAPVSMRDVVRAAIAETEDLDRVEFSVDDRIAVAGHSVADLTHLLAELTENAVRFSPPDSIVTIRSRPNRVEMGGQVLTIEDWGVGMPERELEAANDLLARPKDVDLSVSQRLGFHVVARLAVRHDIEVSLSLTPGSGLTAVAVLPATLFVADPQAGPHAGIGAGPEQTRRASAVHERRESRPAAVASLPSGPSSVPTTALPGLAAATGQAGSDTAVWSTPQQRTPRPAPAPAPPPERVVTGFGSVTDLFAQNGNWSGWWDPAADRANGYANGASHDAGTNGSGAPAADPAATIAFPVTPANGASGSTTSGLSGDGTTASGHGTGGSGSGVNGFGVNGSGTNGSGTNGSGTNGSGTNGSGTNRAGVDGAGANGAAAHRADVDRADVNGAAGDGAADGGAADDGAPSRAALPKRTPAAPETPKIAPGAAQARTTTPANGTPVAQAADTDAASPSSPQPPSALPVPAQVAGPHASTSHATTSHDAAPQFTPEARPSDPAPIPTQRPAPAPTADAGTGTSGLRRRVPQASLAPELRSVPDRPDPAPPVRTAEAADALSRYQASRRAAQAVAAENAQSDSDRRSNR